MLINTEAYRGGHEGIFYYGLETADYPSGVSVPNPAVPASVVWGGWADVPEEVVDDGTKEVYGLGSDDPQVIVPGGRTHTLSVTTRLANKGLLQKCFKGSGGYRNLADLCLVIGHSNVSSAGASRALRFAKCNSGTINFSEGSAQDITAALQFWGLAEESFSVQTPTSTDILAYGAPLTWHNVTEVNIGSYNVRDTLSSMSLTWNNNLERKGFRPDHGISSVWARTTYALLPRQKSYGCEMTFHSPDVAAEVLELMGSATATGAFSIVVTDAGSSIQGNTARTFTFTGGIGRIRTRTRRGGDSAQELMGSISLALKSLALT